MTLAQTWDLSCIWGETNPRGGVTASRCIETICDVTCLIHVRPKEGFAEANYCFVSCSSLGDKKSFQITDTRNRPLIQHSFLPLNARPAKPTQTIG